MIHKETKHILKYWTLPENYGPGRTLSHDARHSPRAQPMTHKSPKISARNRPEITVDNFTEIKYNVSRRNRCKVT